MNRHKFQLDQQTVAFKIEQKIFDQCNWPLHTDLWFRAFAILLHIVLKCFNATFLIEFLSFFTLKYIIIEDRRSAGT